MPARLIVLLVALGVGVAGVSSVALKSGLDEARLAASGARRDLEPPELLGARGWVAAFGCVRHDLAVGVGPSGRAYRLGVTRPETDDRDRVFTPLAARDDCDDDRPPRALYALVEDDEALASTLNQVFRQRVAPPPVPAIVTGVIGYGAGHGRAADSARALLAASGVDAAKLPLFVKGKRPGVLWVALVTAGAGVHGFLLCALGAVWAVRRHRRRRARAANESADAEDEFFNSETIN